MLHPNFETPEGGSPTPEFRARSCSYQGDKSQAKKRSPKKTWSTVSKPTGISMDALRFGQ